jgi:hypothetical protein
MRAGTLLASTFNEKIPKPGVYLQTMKFGVKLSNNQIRELVLSIDKKGVIYKS